MKSAILIASFIAISFGNLSACEDLEEYYEVTEAIWNPHTGEDDRLNEAISRSMMIWGVGLAIGIGLLAGYVHQSSATSQ